MTKSLAQSALDYHRQAPFGKIEVVPTKPLANQRDLALAYSPGVAAACEAIVADPREASTLTARANLVAVLTNGTAVLGLGAIGPLAAKPVMEGKGVLFKKFAGIDVFDIEVNETNVDKLVDIVASLEPTFGGINLEDIKAPECFEVEARLRERMKIPVFHDDQHGTAIIVAAAVINGLKVQDKDLKSVKLVSSGAGAAALACLDLLVDLVGIPLENITVTDLAGVVYQGRVELMDARKARYAKPTADRTLAEAIEGADIFLGLSAAGVLKPEMVARMAPKPLILALANPTPEILPDEVRRVRADAVVATGRSDFPNQVNNVLCFPFIFRGALDVGATTINEEMKKAAVQVIAELAHAEASDVVAAAYGDAPLKFGPDYIIPKPFDPRLIVAIAPAVARAAMDSGVATRPIEDFDQYRERLSQFVYRSGQTMRPLFARAKQDIKRVAYAEGEDPRILQAVQVVVDEGLARPILIGRRDVVLKRIAHHGLRLALDTDFDLVDPEQDVRFKDYWTHYHRLMERRGVTPSSARTVVRTNTTVIAALMLLRNEADAMLAGAVGNATGHLKNTIDILGLQPGVSNASALNALILRRGTIFLCDTHVNPDPTAEQIAEMTLLAAAAVKRFLIQPKIALLSHSNFGSQNTPAAIKMRQALEMVLQREPELEVEGEMHAHAALSEDIRQRLFPNSRLKGEANLLVMPSLDAAHIALNLARSVADCQSVGPILLGSARPAHILSQSSSVRSIVNMTAVAAVDAQAHADIAGRILI